jgi:AAA15 family ATPase/GTPase
MILEIRLSNFYSIKEEIVLDLEAAKINTERARNLNNHISKVGKKEVLKSVALYGANASGKTNIIKAIRFCASMVYHSHNHNENVVFNFKPFKFDGFSHQPSTFFIRFIADAIEYEYSFSLSQKSILTEELYFYPKRKRAKIFSRDENRGKSKSDIYDFTNVISRPMDVANNTSDKTLFISRASQMDREIGKTIFNFFFSQFILGYSGHNSPLVEGLFRKFKPQLLKGLQIADSDIVDIRMKKEKRKGKNIDTDLLSNTATIKDVENEALVFTTYHRADPTKAFDMLSEESTGTNVLFATMLTILDVITNNKILLIDEIEGSLHTEIVEYIVNLFHASERAQLIFTTHNTNLLDLNKIRKDQIYFVNKLENGASELYSLFDFKDFRDTMDVEKAYLQGRFDAIPYVNDSVSNLESLINES